MHSPIHIYNFVSEYVLMYNYIKKLAVFSLDLYVLPPLYVSSSKSMSFLGTALYSVMWLYHSFSYSSTGL
jgi:hypothetical protein